MFRIRIRTMLANRDPHGPGSGDRDTVKFLSVRYYLLHIQICRNQTKSIYLPPQVQV
jgi:hypothetical protein